MNTPGPLAPAGPADVLARPPVNHSARFRRGWECAFAIAVTFGPLGVLLAALAAPAALLVLLFLGWISVVPFAGLALLVYALREGDARSRRALVAAVLALVGSVAVLSRVDRAGTELFLSLHEVELDALALEVVAAPADVRGFATGGRVASNASLADDPALAAADSAATALLERARRLGVSFQLAEQGVIVMRGTSPFGSNLLYRREIPDAPSHDCAERGGHFAGGRWYVVRCGW